MAQPVKTHVPRILVVDDDPSVSHAIAGLLRHAGYDILEASDGEQAMALLQQNPVDLAIIDIFMPKVDGMELISHLRALMPDVKVISVSGGGTIDTEEVLKIARRFGAARTLAKPFESEDLVAAVRELLGETSK